MPLPGRLISMTFERPTYTADAVGGQVATFATLYSAVSGSLQEVKSKTIEEFAKRSAITAFRFYTETQIALLTGDRAYDGTDYYVVQSSSDQGGQGRVYSADLILKD